MTCPTSEDLMNAVDDADFLHEKECARCHAELEQMRMLVRALRLPSAADTHDAEEVAKKVLANINATASARNTLPSRAVSWWPLVALAASIVFALGVYRVGDESTLRARGVGVGDASSQAVLARRTGVTLYRLEGAKPIVLQRGERLSPHTAFVASYRNISSSGDEYLAAFLVDSKGETHWLYPAYTSPTDSPMSVKLTPSVEERLLPSAVAFDDVPSGEARVLMLRTRVPVDIRALDEIRNPTLAMLASRFSDGVVDELIVHF